MSVNLKIVSIDLIDPNPFRLLAEYPYNQEKLDTLCRSIADVGLWEGIIARPKAGRYEASFGHHRLEAGRLSGLDKITLIVRDLTDTQMLQFMGRENLEEYNTNFLVMLETWEAAVVFNERPTMKGHSAQAIDIARLLGWTRGHSTRPTDQLNATASACNAAYALIAGGYLDREDLRGMSVRSAREIVERTQARIEQLDKIGKETRRPAKEIEAAKEQVGKGAQETARQQRAGQLAHKDLRGQVDVNAYQFAKQSEKIGPLLSVFAKGLADSLAKLLKDDIAAQKLTQIHEALGDVTLDEDKQIIARLDFELAGIGTRSHMWQRRLTLPSTKVVNLQVAATKGD
jgi:ParB/RepB/Spo0J family partition protein